MSDNLVLVTGATGKQGGATARQLLAAGWRVRALVRDADNPAAARLAAAGAQLAVGDLTDPDSLHRAAAGAYGVFSVQPAATEPRHDPLEVRMGRTVADAAVAAGVEHFVYASVGGADRNTGIEHWETKWQVEQHIRRLPLPYTILRPVMFMENHASRGPFGVFGENALIRMITPTDTVQVIAVDDIGAFAALAFTRPDEYRGIELEIAGDEVTGAQLAAGIEAAIGRPVDTTPLPLPGPARAGDTGSFGGWQADIPALRRRHPGLMTFDTWLDRTGAELFVRAASAHRGA
ncbi:NmrA family transcriptional regulator [Actinocatenispora thailandica]|uniref:NmrA family transcriptional regulator n=1 Tax=Actinocatenispora thailandica TaxID=227318 RepID=A0A7R7HV51_9ACTN|nr:NmrA/HSCARG family protein [Actinocatenispora thailandica]BCJ33787.1 NmrA family transcriptional regulator [Actinocatenispora thailandica]